MTSTIISKFAKRLLFSACALSASAPTLSSDIEGDWNGPFATFNWQRSTANISANPDPGALIWTENFFTFAGSKSSLTGALSLGYRRELGGLVFGAEVEAVINGSNTIRHDVSAPFFAGAPDNLILAAQMYLRVKPKFRAVGTIEVPVGSRLLIGGEAGVTRAKATLSGNIYGPRDFFTGEPEHWASFYGVSNQTGFTYGVRASLKVTEKLSLKAGYSTVDLGGITTPVTLHDLVLIDVVSIPAAEGTTKLESVKFGIGYQF